MSLFTDAWVKGRMDEAIAIFSSLSEEEKMTVANDDYYSEDLGIEIAVLRPILRFIDVRWYECLYPYLSDINISEYGNAYTALSYAISSGKVSEVKWLLDHHADVSGPFNADTPLTYVATNGTPEMFDLILSANPRFDEESHNKISTSGRYEIIKMTMEHLASKGALTPRLIAIYFQGLLHHSHHVIDDHIESFLKTYHVDPNYFSYSNIDYSDTTIPRLAPLLITYGVLTSTYVSRFGDCAIRCGYYDAMRIFYTVEVLHPTVRTVVDSPCIIDILSFITSFKRYRTSRGASQCALRWFRNALTLEPSRPSDPIVLAEVERIYHVRRNVMDELPTLFDMIIVTERANFNRREMEKLERRIEEAKITKDWRSILN